MGEVTKSDLVIRAKQGDVNAFSRLYEEVYRDLYRFAFYTLGHAEDAEDVVSDTVTDAFASIHKLKHAEAFHGWIFKILSNKCKMVLKQYTKKNVSIDALSTQGENPLEVLTNAATEPFNDDALSIYDIQNAFRTLSLDERIILSYTIFGGYNASETASMIRKNPGTVRSLKSRAIAKLQKTLHLEL